MERTRPRGPYDVYVTQAATSPGEGPDQFETLTLASAPHVMIGEIDVADDAEGSAEELTLAVCRVRGCPDLDPLELLASLATMAHRMPLTGEERVSASGARRARRFGLTRVPIGSDVPRTHVVLWVCWQDDERY